MSGFGGVIEASYHMSILLMVRIQWGCFVHFVSSSKHTFPQDMHAYILVKAVHLAWIIPNTINDPWSNYNGSLFDTLSFLV